MKEREREREEEEEEEEEGVFDDDFSDEKNDFIGDFEIEVMTSLIRPRKRR